MNGYGAIPDTDCVYAPGSAADSGRTSNPPQSTLESHGAHTNVSSILSKFGLVFGGFILGYFHNTLSERSSFAAKRQTVRMNHLKLVAKTQVDLIEQHAQKGIFNNKSFLDSLPFEEIYPRKLWNPVQIPPTEPFEIPERDEPESNSTQPSVPGHNGHKHKRLIHEPSIEQDATNSLSFASIKSLLLGSPASLFPTTSTSISSTKAHILYLANEAAFSLLYDSSNPKNYYLNEYALDYFLLGSGGFDAQINQAYCAVASVAALLNSLKYAKRFRDGDTGWTFDLPVDRVYDPYPYATQQDILMGDCVANTVIGHESVRDGNDVMYGIFKPPYGLNLDQASNLIKCHTFSTDWDVTVQEVDPSKINLSKMRYDLKSALIDPDARVMINYDRKGLNQVGGGHFSPIGAYHAATDSFLVMDVAKYKYPPVWVGADTLFDAMATVDNCGSYDFPIAQQWLIDSTLDPTNKDDYAKALGVLGCKQKMRGYIILKKKP
jgi:hypothetical protein